MIRGLLLLFVLLVSGCKERSSWAFDRIESGSSDFNSTKLTHYTKDPISEVDLEFLKIQDNLFAYINVHSVPIPPLKNDPKHAFVYITIDGKKHRFEALRREGGQRLQLPCDATSLLLASLQEKQPIEILVSGYAAKISPSGFSDSYEKMQKKNPIRNPFQLPF